jgi:hypothetical protein
LPFSPQKITPKSIPTGFFATRALRQGDGMRKRLEMDEAGASKRKEEERMQKGDSVAARSMDASHSIDASCQLHVSLHDGDTLGVDSTQIRV